MMHNFQIMAGTLGNGVIEHLSLWEGWAVLIAAALFGWRTAPWWMPIVVALIINPTPYGVVADVVHGRHPNPYTAAIFTVCQLVLAYAGFLIGRLARRFR